MEANGKVRIAPHEIGVDALGLARDLDAAEAFEDFFPENAQLQFREPVADAAMDAEAEGEMLARTRPVDDELLRALDRRLRRDCRRDTT